MTETIPRLEEQPSYALSRVAGYREETLQEPTTTRISGLDIVGPSRRRIATPPPKRRLRGFVIAFQGDQVRVGFAGDDHSVIEYLLPAANLKKARITAPNQPFEMDEFEQTDQDGFSLTYRFRPMASAESAFTETLELGDDLAELRDAALRHFGSHAQD